MILKFVYINGKAHDPAMSAGLRALLVETLIGTYGDNCEVTIVDAGTVGDARHKKDNPRSYHLHTPPDAIDIEKIFVKIGETPTSTSILKTLNPYWKEERLSWKMRFEARGGKCYHATDKRKNHLHVQIEAEYDEVPE